MRRAVGSSARAGALALAFAAIWAGTAPSTATGAVIGWTDPVDVSPAGHDPWRHAVLVAPDRRLIVVWLTAGEGELWASDRVPGQAWSVERRLSSPGTEVEAPGFAMDDHGNVTVVWRASRPDGSTAIESVYRPHGGGWGAPVQVAAPAAEGPSPRVAVDDEGRAVALWEQELGATDVLYAADRAADGRWSAPVAVSDPDGRMLYGAGVSIGPDGGAVATWIAHDEFERRRVHVSSRPPGDGWSEPLLLSDPGYEAHGVTRHIGPSGAATLVWTRSTGGGVAIESVTRPSGGEWSEPMPVSGAGDNVDGFTAAANAAGDLMIVWRSWHRFHDGTLYRPLTSALRPAAGEWSEPALIDDGPATGPRVTLAADGDALVVWQTVDHSAPSRVRAATYSFGSWRRPTDVATAGDDDRGFALASNPVGDTTILAWLHGAPGHRVVRVSGRDVTRPVLSDVAVPDTAVAGEPVTFAVSAFDFWAAPPLVTWRIGDATYTGTRVRHTFPVDPSLHARHRARHSVVVRAADDVGNGSVARRAITVFRPAAPRPAAPPPTIRLRVPRQGLRRAVRAGVLRAACRPSAPGVCRARAHLRRGRAERLGIRGRRRGNRVVLASGRTKVATRGVAHLRLRIPRRTRISLRRFHRPLVVRLTATARFRSRHRATTATRLRLTRR